MKNCIIYCVFNELNYIKEATYSILSLKRFSDFPNINITIYTNLDEKNFFELFKYPNITIQKVDNSELRRWTNDSRYVYRAKIMVILHHFKQNKNSNLLFVDCDTYFINSPLKILESLDEKVYMHSSLCSLEKALNYIEKNYIYIKTIPNVETRYKLYKDVVDKVFPFKTKKETVFSHYNSGVIGISYKLKTLLVDALNLSDYLFEKYSFHCSEEFAISWIFYINNVTVDEAFHCIAHYCFYKDLRLVLGFLEGKFILDDEMQYMKFLKEFGLESLNFFNLNYYNLISFSKFLLNFALKQNSKNIFAPIYYGKDSYLYLNTDKNLKEIKRFYSEYIKRNDYKI